MSHVPPDPSKTAPLTMEDPIHTIQESDGRWLAWTENPRIASYGATEEEAAAETWNALRDPELLSALEDSEGFAIPDTEDDGILGEQLLHILARWTGISLEDLHAASRNTR